MILRIEQTKVNYNLEWQASCRGEHFATASAPWVRGKMEAVINYASGKQNKIYYNPTDTTYGKSLVDRLSFKLLDGKNKVGYLVGQTQKAGFLKSYPYYKYDYYGDLYSAYEVGFGPKDLYICLYSGEELVAIVDKDLTVKDFKDTYTAYMKDGKYAEIITPLVIYYDIISYGDLGNVDAISVQRKQVYTPQPALKEKYQESFIPEVKALE